jgi:two-component system response regulator FlrC
LLGTRTWRGNIRELENAVHRAVLIAKTEFIGTDDFMPEEGQCQLQLNTGSLKDMEMDLIMKTLEDTNGNICHRYMVNNIQACWMAHILNTK